MEVDDGKGFKKKKTDLAVLRKRRPYCILIDVNDRLRAVYLRRRPPSDFEIPGGGNSRRRRRRRTIASFRGGRREVIYVRRRPGGNALAGQLARGNFFFPSARNVFSVIKFTFARLSRNPAVHHGTNLTVHHRRNRIPYTSVPRSSRCRSIRPVVVDDGGNRFRRRNLWAVVRNKFRPVTV